jgi:hypothetical protein
MTTLAPWLLALQARAAGESPGAHIARIVRGVAGCSLDHEPEKLAQLFEVNESDPATARRVSTYATNCGTSMRCIMALAGCDHPLVTRPYTVQMAVAWCLTAAREKGALTTHRSMIPQSVWTKLGPGWGLHYYGLRPNDDHVEWCLERPDSHGIALHGGGGRARNAITLAGPNSLLWSSGRPLRGIIDPDLLLRPAPPYALTTTRGVQSALAALGYDPGPVDGVMGPRTRAAVMAFQRSAGLVVDGVVGPATRGALARSLAR